MYWLRVSFRDLLLEYSLYLSPIKTILLCAEMYIVGPSADHICK